MRLLLVAMLLGGAIGGVVFISATPYTNRTLAAFAPRPLVGGQAESESNSEIDKSCRGLHAGIRTEFVKRNPPYTRPSFVMVSFVLLNDTDTVEDTSEGSWKLVIDGKELDDSAMIFGSGLMPVGGWKTLNPGGTAEFGKGLDTDRYFPEAGDYKVSWKGDGFQSPTITVAVPANRG